MGFRVGPWDDVQPLAVNVAASGDTILLAGVAGKSIVVLSLMLVAAAEVTVKFKSNSNDKTGGMAFAANGGLTADSRHGLFSGERGGDLTINLSGAVQTGGSLMYAYIS